MKRSSCRLKALSGNQMILDFGQKNFGARRCKECSMLYVVGDMEDLKAHARFHASYLSPEIKVSRWQNQVILEDFFDGSRVIEISLADRMGLQLYTKVASFMNRDLGQDCPQGGVNTIPHLPSYMRIFIFIEGEKKTAVGCCIAEELTSTTVAQRGYQIRRLVGGLRSLLSWRVQNPLAVWTEPVEGSNNNSNIDRITFPLCGIRRLWVASKHRRRGVGTVLVESLLKHLVYLTHLPRSNVAFAEPTASGAEFAVRFVGREDFIVY
ncbi:N-acetyltransferase ESCO1 [Echinococcus granulosus]|uniref:N acetyltransferase ESCO1 n=2 Tax=Echinococcus granulosus TaxID=6210 RepID=A0A068W9U3_ECHGR|nr:N-acetyltransferase ESCO1 [Echinococcus granulosus]CDS15159.1 N acetyltransferase ESCO1 [Echinococcus granulosus]